jgi:FkbM family methyltransferase
MVLCFIVKKIFRRLIALRLFAAENGEIMQLVYQIIYHPAINKVWRNLLKPFAKSLKGISKLPVSGVVSLKLNDGKVLKIATNPTSFATKHLFWEGVEAFEYVPIFIRLIKNCRSFYDIGANTGLYTVLANKCQPQIHVFAFEPSSGPYHYLEKNIKINGCEHTKSFKLALSDQKDTVDFHEVINYKYRFLKHNLGGVGNMANKISHRKMETTQVQSETADALWRAHGGQPVDLVKIDTEATEDYILRGMSEIISAHEPIIICETLYNKIEGVVEDIIRQYPQYSFYNHVDGKLVKVDGIRRSTDNGVRDCFFVPASKTDWIQEFL